MDNAPKLKESMVDMQDEDFTDESDEEDWSIKIMVKTFVIKIHGSPLCKLYGVS